MDVIMHMHVIPSIGTPTKEKTKNQVRLELEMYFDELMHITTSTDLEINIDTMHQYLSSLTALKNMMRMLSDELDRGAKSLYPNAMESRVRFQKEVTTEYTDIIKDCQAWHHFITVDHHEDVEELVFP